MNLNDILFVRDLDGFVTRFNDRLDRRADCWYWTGARKTNGYGNVCFRGKWFQAHRVMWVIHNGAIPDGIMVLHRCDNRACCNPKHLFLGTHTDNMRDMVAKGRGRLIARWAARLTEDQVCAIRADLRSQRAIAVEYGVSQNAVMKIKTRKTWKHLG